MLSRNIWKRILIGLAWAVMIPTAIGACFMIFIARGMAAADTNQTVKLWTLEECVQFYGLVGGSIGTGQQFYGLVGGSIGTGQWLLAKYVWGWSSRMWFGWIVGGMIGWIGLGYALEQYTFYGTPVITSMVLWYITASLIQWLVLYQTVQNAWWWLVVHSVVLGILCITELVIMTWPQLGPTWILLFLPSLYGMTTGYTAMMFRPKP